MDVKRRYGMTQLKWNKTNWKERKLNNASALVNRRGLAEQKISAAHQNTNSIQGGPEKTEQDTSNNMWMQ